jgi:hypothetical protein
MEAAIREATRAAARLLNEYAPVALTSEQYSENRAQFPWRKQPQTRVIGRISALDVKLTPKSQFPDAP